MTRTPTSTDFVCLWFVWGLVGSFELQYTGRWAHRTTYIQSLGQRYGLRLENSTTLVGHTHFVRPAPSQIYRRDEPLSQFGVVFVYQKPL